MTLAEGCLLGAVLLFLLTIAPFKALGYRDFDNAKPRDPDFYGDPLRSRALGAHMNGIETFPFFAATVLLAEFRHAPQGRIDQLAIGFLLVRAAFVAAYVGDRSTLRTMLWNVGFGFNLGIFFLPGFGTIGALVAVFAGCVFAILTGAILFAGRDARRPPRSAHPGEGRGPAAPR